MAASTRMTTQMGPQEKHSLRMGLSMMNLGFPNATRHMTAETVRMMTHSRGRKPPMAPEMMSAMILTTTVQSPSAFLTGIMNRITPMIEGMRNRAFRLPLLFVVLFSTFFSLLKR